MISTPALRRIRREEFPDLLDLDLVVQCRNDIAVPTFSRREQDECSTDKSIETALSLLRSQPRYEGFRLPRPRAAGFVVPFAPARPLAAGFAAPRPLAAPFGAALVPDGEPPPRL